jgi:phage terminase large subunit
MAINELLRQAAGCVAPRPRYAYMAPLYRQAKTIAWDYLRYYAAPIPGTEFNEAELAATLPNGARIELLGAQDYHYLRGRYLDGICLDEYAYMAPEAWSQVIRPALVDRQGFALFIGTPLGRNHFHALYEKARARPEFLTACWPASVTGVVPEAELAAARLDMTPEEYAQEFECSFDAAIRGAYYARELATARAEQRIRAVPWEPTVEVETWWDLGHTDATAIVYTQQVGREVHVLDYTEDRGKDLAFYVKAVRERPYIYRRHHLPHDATAKHLAAGGQSIDQQVRALGLRPTQVHPAGEVLDGIHQARTLFGRCWFDELKCARLVDALAFYHAKLDPLRQTEKPEPEHDWSSHAADAFRYMATGLRDAVQRERTARPYPARTEFNPLRYGVTPKWTAGNVPRGRPWR